MGKRIIVLHSKQRVPVSPELVLELGSVIVAYFYTQLLYYDLYDDVDNEGYFEKSSRRIESDIGITRKQQDRCRTALEQLGWIDFKTVVGGKKPTTLYRVLIRHESP